jgi:SOS-response transcriptional repressor LexA
MMTTTLTCLTLSEILARLMFKQQIRVAELARRTGVPQPTLQRMVTGTVENPHHTSLQPLAEYFQITVEQLKGLEPITWLQPKTPDAMGWMRIPLLSWEQATNWINTSELPTESEQLFTDAVVGPKAYALKMKDSSMEPLFPRGTLLIIDPDKLPKDRSFVVATLKNYPEVIFRQLIIDGPYYYLKPISPDFDRFKMNLLTESDTLVGVLVQARQDYNYEE